MLKRAAIFAVIALVPGVLGFGGIAGFAWHIAKILFWLAVVIAVALPVLGACHLLEGDLMRAALLAVGVAL